MRPPRSSTALHRTFITFLRRVFLAAHIRFFFRIQFALSFHPLHRLARGGEVEALAGKLRAPPAKLLCAFVGKLIFGFVPCTVDAPFDQHEAALDAPPHHTRGTRVQVSVPKSSLCSLCLVRTSTHGTPLSLSSNLHGHSRLIARSTTLSKTFIDHCMLLV